MGWTLSFKRDTRKQDLVAHSRSDSLFRAMLRASITIWDAVGKYFGTTTLSRAFVSEMGMEKRKAPQIWSMTLNSSTRD